MENFITTPNLCAAAATSGILSHLLYFIRGEHHQYSPRWITRALMGIAAAALTVLQFTNFDLLRTFQLTTLLAISYFVALYTSIAIYRLFFHRLGRFPGPYWARISNFYAVYMFRKSDTYLVVRELHEKYGPIVRTGPSNLSINDAGSIQTILSNESKCYKSDWYDMALPLVNLHTVRDKKAHDARRRIFSKAFSPSALRDYEVRLEVHCEEFVRQMKKISGQSFNASNWFKYFAFDVMGDLALGKEFHMMTTETNRWIPDLLERSMGDIGPLFPVPWLSPIVHMTPSVGDDTRAWMEFVESQVKERTQKQSARLDILTHLIDAYNETDKKDIDYQWLRGDTRLTTVAGSDTTAAVLTFLFYHFARDPTQVQKLRAELEPLLQGGTQLDSKDIAKAQHLNGVIQETIRMHPAIPSGFPRVTPPEGITVLDTFIPGGTIVTIPVYTMQRDEINYTMADKFIPERWYSRPDLIKNREAFLGWNIGTNGCIGRGLAISEMKRFVCHFIANFESVRFAPGENGSRLLNETKDHFTLGVTTMNLIFEEKKRA